MSKLKSVNIIIPCYNVSNEIDEFINDANKYLPNNEYDFTYTFINDFSIDNTKQMLIKYIAQYSYIRLIDLSNHFGYNQAILAGINYSLDFDITIIYDIELHIPILTINEMLSLHSKNNKYIKTYQKNIKSSTKQRLQEKLFNLLTSKSKYKLNQYQLNVELLDKQVVKEISQIQEYDPYFNSISSYIGFNPINLPVYISEHNLILNHEESQKLYSKNNLRSVITSTDSLYKLLARISLTLALLPSLTTIILIILTPFLITLTLIQTVISGIILIVLSIFFILFSLIFYLLSNIFQSTKRRPNYIVESIYTH